MKHVLITRSAEGETINGKPRQSRVYVTGPHLGGAFSSTDHREQATRYTAAEAAHWIGQCASWGDTSTEPA